MKKFLIEQLPRSRSQLDTVFLLREKQHFSTALRKTPKQGMNAANSILMRTVQIEKYRVYFWGGAHQYDSPQSHQTKKK